MTRLISAETLKLRSTRAPYAIALGSLMLITIAATAVAALSSFHHGEHPGRDALSTAGFAQTAALLLGILTVTNEYRYLTITPALLAAPKRTPLLAAKTVNLGLVGLILGLLAFGGATAIVLPILSSRGIPSQLDTAHLAGIIIGGTLASAMFAALGVGIGAIVRNQVAAIVAALGVLYAIEPLLTLIPGVGDAAQKFGLGGLSAAASGTTAFGTQVHLLGQAPGALILAGYALAALLVGAALLQRRDITA